MTICEKHQETMRKSKFGTHYCRSCQREKQIKEQQNKMVGK